MKNPIFQFMRTVCTQIMMRSIKSFVDALGLWKNSLHKLQNGSIFWGFREVSYPHYPQVYPQKNRGKPLPNHVRQGSDYKYLHFSTDVENRGFGLQNTESKPHFDVENPCLFAVFICLSV